MKTDYNNLPERIDYLISEIAGIKELLTQRIRNPEEIPKYLDINQALLYLGKLGFLISRSKLYKLTSGNNIPCHKSITGFISFHRSWIVGCLARLKRKVKRARTFQTNQNNLL